MNQGDFFVSDRTDIFYYLLVGGAVELLWYLIQQNYMLEASSRYFVYNLIERFIIYASNNQAVRLTFKYQVLIVD